MTTDNKTNKEQNAKPKEYKILEWEEEQFSANSDAALIFGRDEGHIQKIHLESGSNLYLVPEKFYKQAMAVIRGNKQDDETI